MRTPPSDGITILRRSAVFISSCPTIAAKGYVTLFFIPISFLEKKH